jgi:hypothetical protein
LICTVPQVTVTWDSVADSGAGNFTYELQRDGRRVTTCDPTVTTCIDTPGSGKHLYRVSSIDSSGNMSPLSAAAEAIEP